MSHTHAALIAIGDELALGQTADTNTAYLAVRLAERGLIASFHQTVPDDRLAILAAFRRAAAEAPLVIVTGGLGPTEDDLTRFALADLLGDPLLLDDASLAAIREFFERRGRAMPDRNRVQAMRPASATLLANPVGTAPAIHARSGEAAIFCLPGVPSEMRALFDLHLAPVLDADRGAGFASRNVILTAQLNTFGAGESDVADRLGDLMDRTRNPLIGTTVAEGIVSVRIRGEFPDRAAAERELERTVAEAAARLGILLFSRGKTTMAETVGAMLKEHHKTLAAAESCTAGLLTKLLTDPPGSSDYLKAGWVVYSNEAKSRDLAVSADVIERHGAVSEPVARALADNARHRADTDFALAITGIAGPTGGSPDKPVGTVWIALAQRGRDTLARRFILPGDRPMIRSRAAMTAMNLLRLRLLRAV